jgi:hypothetical protein
MSEWVATMADLKRRLAALLATPEGKALIEIAGTTIAVKTTVNPTNSTTTSPPTILMNKPATGAGTGVALTIKWPTSGLPLDSNLSGNTNIFGNGNWDCLDYWKLNHSAAAPSGCTSSNPTISRYQVYRYEMELSRALLNFAKRALP